MMILSVLLIVALVQIAQCRRLRDDLDSLDNDIASSATDNGFEKLKFNIAPKQVIRKLVGSYVELECEAAGSPPPTLQWLKDKIPLTENESFESNIISNGPSQGMAIVRTRLVINYLLPIHSGRFTCLAESQSGAIKADTDVFVIKKGDFQCNFTQLLTSKILGAHHEPRVTYWAPSYFEVTGSSVILPCQTVGNPKPTQMWFDPQGQLIGETDGRVSVLPDGELSIRSVTWEDMGMYRCIVRNSVGQDSAETFFYPLKPSD